MDAILDQAVRPETYSDGNDQDGRPPVRRIRRFAVCEAPGCGRRATLMEGAWAYYLWCETHFTETTFAVTYLVKDARGKTAKKVVENHLGFFPTW